MPKQSYSTARRGKKPVKQTTLTFRESGSKFRPRTTVVKDESSDSDSAAAMRLSQKRRDEEDALLSSPIKRRRIRVLDSDEEAQAGSVTRKVKSTARLARALQPESDAASENSPRPLSRKKRKLSRGTKPVSHSDSEEDDLDEDREFFCLLVLLTYQQSSSRADCVLVARRLLSKKIWKNSSVKPGPCNDLNSLLKYAGKKQGKSPVSEHSDSESGSDDDSAYEEDTAPFEGARPDGDDTSLFGSDDGENDWIVQDDGNATALLPTQFSMEGACLFALVSGFVSD